MTPRARCQSIAQPSEEALPARYSAGPCYFIPYFLVRLEPILGTLRYVGGTTAKERHRAAKNSPEFARTDLQIAA